MSEDEERRGIRMDSERGWPPRSQQGFTAIRSQSLQAHCMTMSASLAASRDQMTGLFIHLSPGRRAVLKARWTKLSHAKPPGTGLPSTVTTAQPLAVTITVRLRLQLQILYCL